ncbi:hypothetical protein [Nannocystis punicea]|uniref:Lipoprotein n=1 Tax=Nannocystis punicea TaxID=2995304 RepID=A0ABY7HFN8_9BACT|nr:hypothetical protein [Nannocystis poenicansa]WAS98011.1 hypothetical protein O0S08_17865 [Nannocystis poenicansa]
MNSSKIVTLVSMTRIRVWMPALALAAAACDDAEELGQDSEAELAEAADAADELALPEEDADAEQSPLEGPESLQAAPQDPAALTPSVCCELEFEDPFLISVRLTNPGPVGIGPCSDFFAGQSNLIYKVTHAFGSPAPFFGTTGPLPLGSTRKIPLSHTGYLNAISCEAFRP